MWRAGFLSFMVHMAVLLLFFFATPIGEDASLPKQHRAVMVDIGYGPGVGVDQSTELDTIEYGSVLLPTYIPRPPQPPEVILRQGDVPPILVRPKVLFEDGKTFAENVSKDFGLFWGRYDTIREHFARCWRHAPLLNLSQQDLVIEVLLRITEEGLIKSGAVKDKERILEDPSLSRFYESVIHAISHPLCRRIYFPKTDYERWQKLTIAFSARLMSGL